MYAQILCKCKNGCPDNTGHMWGGGVQVDNGTPLSRPPLPEIGKSNPEILLMTLPAIWASPSS